MGGLHGSHVIDVCRTFTEDEYHNRSGIAGHEASKLVSLLKKLPH